MMFVHMIAGTRAIVLCVCGACRRATYASRRGRRATPVTELSCLATSLVAEWPSTSPGELFL